MRTRREFLIGFGAGLLLAAGGVWAAGEKGAASPPSDMVRQYLAARARHDSAGQYALFSAKFRSEMPFTQFVEWSAPSSSPVEEGVSPILASVSVFFMDARGASGYQFAVVGPDPDDPRTVLVRALPPNIAPRKAFLIKIVTAPETGGGPRLEILPSFQKTNLHDFVMMREHDRSRTSQSNLKQIGLALMMYAESHDGRLPAADSWVDALQSQWANVPDKAMPDVLFHDPSAPDGQRWNYAFNRALSGARLADLPDPAATVLVFESTTGVKNAADTGQSLPRPGRHSGGSNYLSADGHAKWLPDGAKPSFAPDGK